MATEGGVPIDFDGIFTKTPIPDSEATPCESTPEPSELDGPDGLHLTPIGNAARFLRDYGCDVLWVEGLSINSAGTFYCWDGQRWQPDDAKAVLLAKETVSNLRKLITQALDQSLKSDTITALAKFWCRAETDHAVREILNIAKWDVAIKQGQFDADPNLLGVRNGVVDLRTGELRSAVRKDYITKQANVTFDASATCPSWEQFLLETTDRNHELICYLQQCCGISLTGETKEHLFFLIIGPAATGKSTFCEGVKFTWGDYCIGIDPNSLAAGRAEGGRARPDLVRLAGVRLAFRE